MADVIVTGANGFVGRHIVTALRSDGYDVLATSRTPSPHCDVAVDLSDKGAVRTLLETPARAIVHLAAIAHRKAAPATIHTVNRATAQNIAEAAAERAIETFVLCSSATVYGEYGRKEAIAEDVLRRPVGAYAKSKSEAEEVTLRSMPGSIIYRFPAIYSLDWLVAVRNRVYVPGMKPRVFLKVRGRPPMHSLCAIENAVEATRLALLGGVPAGPYNVTDEAPYSQDDMRAVLAQVDGPAPTVSLPKWFGRLPIELAARSGMSVERIDTLRSHYWKLFEGVVLDTSRIRACGFKPIAAIDGLIAAGALRLP